MSWLGVCLPSVKHVFKSRHGFLAITLCVRLCVCVCVCVCVRSEELSVWKECVIFFLWVCWGLD